VARSGKMEGKSHLFRSFCGENWDFMWINGD
jgi:hypothetical protein